MNNYVGIDLGTTNSAICLYNGDNVRVLKSPEQNDVTPSAILIDRRGNKYVGKRAYDAAPGSPDNAALLFKRFMGSDTKFTFRASGETKTPEECSAEILKILFGYLPEEVRMDGAIGTVITIPAAFNQMQKSATVQAAQMAGIGKVALMQEPVAAVMSVMRSRKTEGVFLVYDLGGGTLDIAIAESMGGHVNLLANGGIQMCGGRDIDRAIFDNVVKPWLVNQFELPENFVTDSRYKRLLRFSGWAVERAKIELSSREESTISLSEIEVSTRDEVGEEIYLDIPLNRKTLDELMEEIIQESIVAVRETIDKAGLTPDDIAKIVYIGGPTNYKPLRDRVSLLLGIASSTEVNPMTAVAEGAALFAESIDWGREDNSRKSSRAKKQTSIPNVSFVYVSRTADVKARLMVQLSGMASTGFEFQIDSMDTGWSSGRMKLADGAEVMLSLSKNGENTFKFYVFNNLGQAIPMQENLVVITRTTASVDIIPASHSIGVAVREANSNVQTLEWLVKSGDSLPKKGQLKFRSAETLKAGSSNSLNFNLWEGEILDPITDNRSIGSLKVRGSDFDEGIIPAGAELICDYEILDSGAINLEVSVPCIGASFPSHRNFYSRQEGQMDFESANELIMLEKEGLGQRINAIEEKGIADDRIQILKKKLAQVDKLMVDSDVEKTQEAQERILETKKLLSQVRREHLQEIRHMELDACANFFEQNLRAYARPAEVESFIALRKTAQRYIDRNSPAFEDALSEMKGNNFAILWRQDWFVLHLFKDAMNNPHKYSDRAKYNLLKERGQQCLRNDETEQLKNIVAQLMQIKIYTGPDEEVTENVNIFKL
ncbi:MAG: Hsp70 family protein [Akkermansia muciniphila]